MRKIEHIGIAVKSLNESNLLFEKLFGKPPYKQEVVESEGVKTSFFMNGPNKIELLEATNAESPIAKFIEKKGEGIHHVAFEVENIEAEMKRLAALGFELLNETPKSFDPLLDPLFAPLLTTLCESALDTLFEALFDGVGNDRVLFAQQSGRGSIFSEGGVEKGVHLDPLHEAHSIDEIRGQRELDPFVLGGVPFDDTRLG